MKKEKQRAEELPQETEAQKEEAREPEFKNAKERLYDNIHVSVKTMDCIIGVLLVAIVAALLLGIWAGKQ